MAHTHTHTQDRAALLEPAEDAVKYLLARGWSLNKVRPMDTHNIPYKQKMTCLRRLRKRVGSMSGRRREEETSYEPEVLDLSKVDTPIELLVSVGGGGGEALVCYSVVFVSPQALAEQMAENAHDKWARELKMSDCESCNEGYPGRFSLTSLSSSSGPPLGCTVPSI